MGTTGGEKEKQKEREGNAMGQRRDERKESLCPMHTDGQAHSLFTRQQHTRHTLHDESDSAQTHILPLSPCSSLAFTCTAPARSHSTRNHSTCIQPHTSSNEPLSSCPEKRTRKDRPVCNLICFGRTGSRVTGVLYPPFHSCNNTLQPIPTRWIKPGKFPSSD